jgi:hypothetical protein
MFFKTFFKKNPNEHRPIHSYDPLLSQTLRSGIKGLGGPFKKIAFKKDFKPDLSFNGKFGFK